MKISKKEINNLIEDVVIPFENFLLEDNAMQKYLVEEDIRIKHNIAIAKLAIEIIRKPSNAREYFKRGAEAHNDLDIETEDMQKYLTIFFTLHKQWCIDNFILDVEEYDKYVEELDKVFMNAYTPGENINEDDGFLMFESEEIQDAINDMHYLDEKKISAEDYLSYNEIFEDDLHSIVELNGDCEEILHRHSELDETFIEDFGNVIKTLSRVLFSTHEFRDVGYALEHFVSQLRELDISSLYQEQRNLVYLLLSQMNEDIRNWIVNIFVKHEAVDIHYFDASFLANIAQFAITVEQSGSEIEESEDDFLF